MIKTSGTRVTTMSKPKAKQSSILNFVSTVPNPPVVVTPEVIPTRPERDSPTELNPSLECDHVSGPRTSPSTTDCEADGSQTPPVSENDQYRVSFESVTSMQNDEVPEKFHPPSTYKFPKRKFGSAVVTERSFQSHWCDTYKWL